MGGKMTCFSFPYPRTRLATCSRSCLLVTVGICSGLSDCILILGLDTGAHALAATLAFLALNFDIQDELASQVRGVTEGRDDDSLVSTSSRVTVWSDVWMTHESEIISFMKIITNLTKYSQHSMKLFECSVSRMIRSVNDVL